jgi:hypothetical protein
MDASQIHPLTLFLGALLLVFTLEEFFAFLLFLTRRND